MGLHVASGLLKINLRCVARGCLGDASERKRRRGGSERITRGCKNLVDTSDSTVKQRRDVCSSLPPTTLQLLLTCCTNY